VSGTVTVRILWSLLVDTPKNCCLSNSCWQTGAFQHRILNA
jgi:hypothetical protein